METRIEGRRVAPARPPDDPAGGELDLLAKALHAVQAAHATEIGGPPTQPPDATFMVEHAGHIIARGTVTVGSGHLTSGEVPRLQAGAYTLTIMSGHGQDNHVLLRESITLPPEDDDRR